MTRRSKVALEFNSCIHSFNNSSSIAEFTLNTESVSNHKFMERIPSTRTIIVDNGVWYRSICDCEKLTTLSTEYTKSGISHVAAFCFAPNGNAISVESTRADILESSLSS